MQQPVSIHDIVIVLPSDMLVSLHLPADHSLKIIRVYSKDIERKDYPGPKHHEDVYGRGRTDARCEPSKREYALHHIVRRKNPKINAIESKFEQLHREGKIPSQKMRAEYRSLVFTSELAALRDGVDIVLCTCNEASSHRIMESIKPVYCIIDECAMATEPECMVPIRQAENVVLIGDHQQLQPVIQCKQAGERGLGCSLFERYVEKVKVEPHMLEIQYRMVSTSSMAVHSFYG